MSEPFDLDRIRRAALVSHVEWHRQIASTNDRGMLVAGDRTISTPFLILAGEQTAGRGRGTNRWWSGAGALTFSLVFDPQSDQESRGSPALESSLWPRVALVAGVALCEVLRELLPHVAYQLKWPNDVLLGGRKVSGILVEIPPASPPARRRLVLGMGVNVNNSFSGAPLEIRSTGIAVCDAAGSEIDATQLLIDWLDRFALRLNDLAVGDADLSRRWQSLCALSGKAVELQSGSRHIRGLCRGIDADGALLIDTDAGPERLYAGAAVRVV